MRVTSASSCSRSLSFIILRHVGGCPPPADTAAHIRYHRLQRLGVGRRARHRAPADGPRREHLSEPARRTSQPRLRTPPRTPHAHALGLDAKLERALLLQRHAGERVHHELPLAQHADTVGCSLQVLVPAVAPGPRRVRRLPQPRAFLPATATVPSGRAAAAATITTSGGAPAGGTAARARGGSAEGRKQVEASRHNVVPHGTCEIVVPARTCPAVPHQMAQASSTSTRGRAAQARAHARVPISGAPSASVTSGRVCAVLQQRLRDRAVTRRARQVKRRAALLCARVRIAAVRQEHRHK